MHTNIGIWKIDGAARGSEEDSLDLDRRISRIESITGTGTKTGWTEKMLEEILANSPEILMRGVSLVGRQVPVEAGYMDLLGIDEDGRLVIFELKRERLTREAVAQLLDYCACLETLSDQEIATLIEEQSARSEGDGIGTISSFEEWYNSRSGESIRPLRMVLVGLGIDRNAERMVAYLSDRGIDMEIVTFHGYRQGGDLLLARQVRTIHDSHRPKSSSSPFREPIDLARENNVERLWTEVRNALDESTGTYYTRSGITYCQRTTTLPQNVHVRGSHSVTIAGLEQLRLTLYPAAIDLGRDDFKTLKRAVRETITFEHEPPPNAPSTQYAQHQCYCILNEEAWKANSSPIIDFIRSMVQKWREHERNLRGTTVE